jgi:hypothetical protein
MQTPVPPRFEQLQHLLPITCAALILGGLLVAAINLGKLPLWVDESIAALPARSIHTHLLPRNPFDLDFMPWQLKYDLWDPATPLYRYALAAFTAVVGFSELNARVFSLLMGGLAALALAMLAREMFGRSTAWVAAALFVTSPTFMLFAREARHFTFLMFVATTTLYLLYVASQRPKSWASALWPVGVVATLLTQTLGYAILPIVALYVALVGPRRALDRRHWPIYLAAASVYVAVMIVFWDTLPFFHAVDCGNRTVGCQPGHWFYLGVLNEFLAPMETGDVYRWWRTFSLAQPLAVLGLAGVALRAVRVRASREPMALLLLWLLVPLVLLSTREVKFARYLFIWAFPVCMLLVARGIVAFCSVPGLRRGHDLAAVLLVIVVSVAPQLRRGEGLDSLRVKPRLALPGYVQEKLLRARDDNWERIRYQAALVERHVGPDDVVVSSFDDASLGYHTGRFIYGFLNSTRTDRFFMELLEKTRAAGHRMWFFDTLPHWNYCLTRGAEPRSIDCAVKYAHFYETCRGVPDDLAESCIRIPIR